MLLYHSDYCNLGENSGDSSNVVRLLSMIMIIIKLSLMVSSFCIGNYETLYEPFLIHSLKHEKIASVSCGNSTTIVSTEVVHEWIGGSDDNDRYRRLKGGEVYIAGSRNVFGEQYDMFTKLPVHPPDHSDDAPVCIKQVSAGFLHSLLVSADGELYCWGHNKTGELLIFLLLSTFVL